MRKDDRITGRNDLSNQSKPLEAIIERDFSKELTGQLARKTGFIQRSRKISAVHFVNSLMFLYGNQLNTSLPDIAADLHPQFSVGKQAIFAYMPCLYFNQKLKKVCIF